MGIEPMRTDPPAPKAGALTTRPSQRKHRKEGNGTIYGLKMPDLEILPTSGQSTNQHLTLRAAIKPENMPSVILATGFPPPQLHNLNAHFFTSSGGYDHTIRFWEAPSGVCYRTIQHPDSVCFLTINNLFFF